MPEAENTTTHDSMGHGILITGLLKQFLEESDFKNNECALSAETSMLPDGNVERTFLVAVFSNATAHKAKPEAPKHGFSETFRNPDDLSRALEEELKKDPNTYLSEEIRDKNKHLQTECLKLKRNPKSLNDQPAGITTLRITQIFSTAANREAEKNDRILTKILKAYAKSGAFFDGIAPPGMSGIGVIFTPPPSKPE